MVVRYPLCFPENKENLVRPEVCYTFSSFSHLVSQCIREVLAQQNQCLILPKCFIYVSKLSQTFFICASELRSTSFDVSFDLN